MIAVDAPGTEIAQRQKIQRKNINPSMKKGMAREKRREIRNEQDLIEFLLQSLVI